MAACRTTTTWAAVETVHSSTDDVVELELDRSHSRPEQPASAAVAVLRIDLVAPGGGSVQWHAPAIVLDVDAAAGVVSMTAAEAEQLAAALLRAVEALTRALGAGGRPRAKVGRTPGDDRVR